MRFTRQLVHSRPLRPAGKGRYNSGAGGGRQDGCRGGGSAKQSCSCVATGLRLLVMKHHRRIDERSLAFGHAIAARLAEQPELIDHARATLARWMTTCSPRSRSTLQEWESALTGPIGGVLELLTATDERATRLRQSNPFAGLLPEQERLAILRQLERCEAHDLARTGPLSPVLGGEG